MIDKYPAALKAVTWTAADVANGNKFTWEAGAILLARNTSADTDYYLTLTSQTDPKTGRVKHITQEDIPFGATRMVPALARDGWANESGEVLLQAENAAIEFALLRVN